MDSVHALTVDGLAAEHARSWPDRIALVDGPLRLTWRQTADRIDRVAGALAALGVTEGDRVLWLGQNSFRIVELLFACGRLGAMVCPVNWRQTSSELEFVLDDLTPRVVVWQEEEIGDEVRALDRTSARWVQHDGDDSEYEALVAAADPHVRTAPGDPSTPVLLIYTAAFSGRPNAAMLSHRAVVAQGLVLAPFFGYDEDTVFLNSGPMFHLGTLFNTFATLVRAGTNVFVRRVEAEDLCRIIDQERCTHAFILGPTVDQVVEMNRDNKFDLSCLRIIGGPPEYVAMTSRDESRWAQSPGGYGQTEVMGMCTLNSLGVGGIGLHGRATPAVELRILGPDGDELPVGEVGEFAARGLTVMNGYWNRDELNAQRFTADGWYRMNDLGRRETDGTITFIGPKTRMIKSAAENIYPVEVENCLRTHPAVADVAIIGIPDPKWVQSVKAIVVVQDGASVTADELIAHCKEHIASYKKPRSVEFVDALPRDGWAVDYDALDEQFGGGGYPGGETRSA